MRLDYNAIKALGSDYESRSTCLSGFSFALLLSIVSEASLRWNWQSVDNPTWDEIDRDVSKCIRELQMSADIGTIVALMTDVIPSRYLLCDGGTYARTDYPDLYAVLPAALIVDANNFTLPDMAGLAVVGATFSRPLLATFGEETHTLTQAEMPAHEHTYFPPTLAATLEGVGAPLPTANVSVTPNLTGSAGLNQPHNNLQPSISLYWCIVAR